VNERGFKWAIRQLLARWGLGSYSQDPNSREHESRTPLNKVRDLKQTKHSNSSADKEREARSFTAAATTSSDEHAVHPSPKTTTKRANHVQQVDKRKSGVKKSQTRLGSTTAEIEKTEARTSRPTPVGPVPTIAQTKAAIATMGLGPVATFRPLNARPSDKDFANIAARLGHVRSQIVPGLDDGRRLLVLGIDVGSTSTKIVLRMPYEAMSQGIAVPVPEYLRAEGHPYYWTTVLWESESGYSLLPDASARRADRLKVNFVQAVTEGAGHEDVRVIDMTAWITLMTRQALGWLHVDRPRTTGTEAYQVVINLGLPARGFESSSMRNLFSRCGLAARHLAEAGVPVNRNTVSIALTAIANRHAEQNGVHIIPELAGAVAGFAASREGHDGLFVLMDVGGLTVDAALFRLAEAKGIDGRIAIFAADLCHYGIDVMRAWVNQGGHEEAISPLIGNFIASSVIAGNLKRYHQPGAQSVELIRTFVIGGGRHSMPHRGGVDWATNSLRNYSRPPALVLSDLSPNPDDLDMDLSEGRNCGRLLVAAGLSRDIIDIPQWTSADQIPDAPKASRSDYEERYITN
jgi:hypothetical protein